VWYINTMVDTIVDILSIRPHSRSFNMNENKHMLQW